MELSLVQSHTRKADINAYMLCFCSSLIVFIDDIDLVSVLVLEFKFLIVC